jgi:hypothetical protein
MAISPEEEIAKMSASEKSKGRDSGLSGRVEYIRDGSPVHLAP